MAFFATTPTPTPLHCCRAEMVGERGKGGKCVLCDHPRRCAVLCCAWTAHAMARSPQSGWHGWRARRLCACLYRGRWPCPIHMVRYGTELGTAAAVRSLCWSLAIPLCVVLCCAALLRNLPYRSLPLRRLWCGAVRCVVSRYLDCDLALTLPLCVGP